jgi:hypothetical protein
MAKQTFTTGQVLTAAQMTSLQQTAMLGGAASAKTASYTLVAADAGTAISMSNAGATTITVNTALFAAGDTVHITNLGAGVCTITAGTATVNSSASLALAQYESGFLDFTSTSAAIFVKGAGAALSGALTIAQIATGNVNSGTSTTISSLSSYDNLLIMFKGLTTATTTPIYQLKINNTASDYYYAAGCGVSSASANQRSSNVNAIDLNVNFGSVTANADNLFMIQLTNCKSTGFTNIQWSGAYKEYSTNANGYSFGTGIFANAAAVSSLVITTDTGATFNGTGTYTIWGA